MTPRMLVDTIRPYVDIGEVPGTVVGVLHDREVPLDAVDATMPHGDTAVTVITLVRMSRIMPSV